MQQIPKHVIEVIAEMKKHGIDSWVIGGAVRDTLLGKPVHDWDLTAASTPEKILEALPAAKLIGGEHGTVTWHGVEITPCRAESDYTDHRHPDKISFGADLRVDLSRRDFTVNAMAWDGENIVDPYRGRYDLKDKLLRAVGEPALRFEEDALRILRLYRFAGTLGFDIEEKTAQEALNRAKTLSYVSAPRVRAEMNKTLLGQKPSILAPFIIKGGLENFGFEDAEITEQNALEALDKVPSSLLCRWWALLHIVKANTFKVATVFDFGKTFAKDFAKMTELYNSGMPSDINALKKLLCGGLAFPFLDVAETFAALDSNFKELPTLYRALKQSGEPYLKENLLITPTELLQLGFKGKKLGEVQRCLLQSVIDTPSYNTKQMLLKFASELKELV